MPRRSEIVAASVLIGRYKLDSAYLHYTLKTGGVFLSIQT